MIEHSVPVCCSFAMPFPLLSWRKRILEAVVMLAMRMPGVFASTRISGYALSVQPRCLLCIREIWVEPGHLVTGCSLPCLSTRICTYLLHTCQASYSSRTLSSSHRSHSSFRSTAAAAIALSSLESAKGTTSTGTWTWTLYCWSILSCSFPMCHCLTWPS